MEKYLFTFGGGHELQGYCQPIFASSYNEARNKMVELHGLSWAFSYTEENWETIKNDPGRIFKLETELEPIYA